MIANGSLTRAQYLSTIHTDEGVGFDWPQPDHALYPDNGTLHEMTMSQKVSPLPQEEAVDTPGTNLDWARYKEIIVRLYIDQNLSMRDLIRTMSKRHGFQATKRMYHTRFAIWRVYKNTKADTKNRLASRVIKAYRQGDELPILTGSEKRKLIRYSKTSQDLGKQDHATLVQAIARTPESCQRVTESMQVLSPTASCASDAQSSYSDMTPAAIVLTPSSSDESSVRHRGTHHVSASPSPPLPVDRRTSNSELLLSCTRHYHEWQYTRPPGFNFELNKNFWSDIKSGIHYVKVGSHELAWPLLRDAGMRVVQLCEHQPLNLLADLYGTMSPANTSACPQFRIQLLRLFARIARTRLGIKHPLSIICHQLQMDSQTETPMRALRLMIDDIEVQPCHQKQKFHQLKRILTTLLRHKRDYAAAESLALAVVKSSSRDFGDESSWTRAASTEYIRILTDQGRWEVAAPICQTVLESGKRGLGNMFPDEHAVYAMEKLAEICEHLRSFDQALTWLDKAFEGAHKVWGPSHSTTYIGSKMERVRALNPAAQPLDLSWK